MDRLLTGVSNPSYRPYRHAHSNLVENHTQHAAESDLPIAGLLTDLKSRGLLRDPGAVARGVTRERVVARHGVDLLVDDTASDTVRRSRFWTAFGPGLLWAATAIGVSHWGLRGIRAVRTGDTRR